MDLEQKKERLANLQFQISTEVQRGAMREQWRIDEWQKEADQLEAEIQSEERAEQHAAIVGDFLDTAQLMFDAIFPKEEYSKKIGLTEYEEKQQQFYQLFHLASSDHVKSIQDTQQQELSKRDEQNKALYEKLMNAEQENAELKGNLQAAETYNIQLQTQLEQIGSENEQLKSELSGKELLVQEKQKHIDQLREDLANAPAPKPAIDVTPRSQTFEQALAAVKETNEQKAKRALDAFLARNPELADIPPIPAISPIPEVKELQFRPDDEQTADAQPKSGELHSAEATTGVGQFQEGNLGSDAVSAPSADFEVAPITRAEIEARFKRIEDYLDMKSWQYDNEVA